jgi:acyl-CoA reductase-like NAD-dependent aldehyde dehydrogenase
MAADNVVPVVMELGGKSPNIVFADADMDLARRASRTRSFRMPDRRARPDRGCWSSASARRVGRRLATRAMACAWGRRERSGHGTDHSKRQLETIERYVQVGTAEGAQIAAGGSRPTDRALGRGFYFQPTLLDRCHPACASRRKRSSGLCSRSSTFDDLMRRDDRQSQ